MERTLFSVFRLVVLSASTLSSGRVGAEVTLDGSLGGVVKSLQGPNYQIKPEDGLTRGRNLFHSFGRFNIDSGETADFVSAPNLSNIFGRVTGGDVSRIFGTILSRDPNVSLWLLNPAGFLFGPGASVSVLGSFHVSTANYLKLGENGVFNAQPNAGDILTTAEPEAFGFLDSKPAAVDMVGTGERGSTILAANKQLGIMAGSVNITDGSAVFGFNGVSIGAVQHAGEIDRNLSKLDPATSGNLGAIALKSNVNVLTNGSSITIRGRDLTVENSTIGTPFQAANVNQSIDIALSGSLAIQGGVSSISTATDAKGPAVDITLKAREVTVRDGAGISSGQFACPVNGACDKTALANGTGRSGNIAIYADRLTVTGYTDTSFGRLGSNINSSTTARGKAGDITLHGFDGESALMNELALSDFGTINSSTINDGPVGSVAIRARHIDMQSQSFVSTSTAGTGSAGTIDIQGAETLKMAGGAKLSAGRIAPRNAVSGGGGDGDGGVLIDADDIELTGESLITTIALEGSIGDADPIVIKAHRLHLDSGASVSAPTLSTGKGGAIRLNADLVELAGDDAAPLTSITSSALGKTADSGAGGSITIEGRQGKGQGTLAITGNAMLSGITTGPAAAASINIDMDEVRISDRGRISAATNGSGRGGDVTVTARRLQVDSGGEVTAATLSTGRGGDVTIRADAVELDGSDPDAFSAIDSESVGKAPGSGAGGLISIEGRQGKGHGTLTVTGRSGIRGSALGAGDAAGINIDMDAVRISGNGRITGSTLGSGQGGDVTVNARTLELSDGGDIVSESGNLLSNGNVLLATGDAGDIRVRASESLRINGSLNGGALSSGISSGTYGEGRAGSVTVESPDIELSDQGRIASDTGGNGPAGSVIVDAAGGRIALTGGANISSRSSITAPDRLLSGSGSAGNVSVRNVGGEIRVDGAGSAIATDTRGPGKAGQVTVEADRISALDGGDINASTTGDGDAGSVTVTGRTVDLSGGGRIRSESGRLTGTGVALAGSGNAGDVRVTATESLSAAGVSADGSARSGIYSRTHSTGRGGSVKVDAPRIALWNRAQISADTSGSGNAGSVNVDAPNGRVTLSGGAQISSRTWVEDGDKLRLGSGSAGSVTVNMPGGELDVGGAESAIATDTRGAGDAGQITVDTDTIGLSDGGTIRSSSSNSGNGGVIAVSADDLTLSREGRIDATTTHGNGGNVDVRVRRLAIREGGSLSTSTSGNGNAGNIAIRGRDSGSAESVTVDGVQVSPGRNGSVPTIQFSGIRLDSNSSGKGGDLDLNSRYVRVSNDAEITAETRGQASGGDLRIHAENVELLDRGSLSASTTGAGQAGQINVDASQAVTIRAKSDPEVFHVAAHGGISSRAIRGGNRNGALGAGGSITVETPKLTISGPAEINASTEGDQNAGNIVIRGGQLTLTDNARITSESGSAGETKWRGNAGRIHITMTDAVILDRGVISSRTVSQGNAGEVSIDAPRTRLENSEISSASEGSGDAGSVVIKNRDRLNLSEGSQVSTSTSGSGAAGEIRLQARRVSLEGGSVVSTATRGSGNAGRITVGAYAGRGAADEVLVAGHAAKERSGFRLNTDGSGQGGKLEIEANQLTVSDQGELSAEAGPAATSEGGSLKVVTRELRVFDGGRISASTQGQAKGGNIHLQSEELELGPQGEIAATSSGAGDAGLIDIDAGERLISRGGRITAEAKQANGGNITLKARERIQLEDSAVTTSVLGGRGPGGNITIDPDLVILKNSRIVANADAGPGGNIAITADQLIQDPASIIDASSRAGVNGRVVISSPDTNMIGKVAALAAKYLDPAALFRERCAARYVAGESNLVVHRIDGVSAAPGEALYGDSFGGDGAAKVPACEGGPPSQESKLD